MNDPRSTLERRLDEDLKNALREKDALRRSVIQMIRSQILLEKKKGKDGGELDEARIVRLIQAHAKKLEDALSHAERAGRPELAGQARRELEIARGYLPEPLTDEELEALVAEAVAGLSEKGPRAMGAVIQAVLGKAGGRADGKRVQAAARKALGSG